MKNNFKASLLVAAISAVGMVSAANADSYIEEKSFSTTGCPTSSTTVTRTSETIATPMVEERTIERPVVIERAPLIEERVRVHGNHDRIKIKEYY